MKGDRSKWFSYIFILYLVGSVLGPTVAIIIFVTLGNHWTLPELRNVFMAGLVLELTAAPFLFMFSDIKQEKKKESDGDGKEKENAKSDADANANEDGDAAPATAKPTSCFGLFSYSSIPMILFIQGVVMSLGSGMTTKFFPLFFQNDMHFNPIQVQAVYIAVPIGMAALSAFSQRVSKRIGRIPTIMLFDVLGIGCLVAMVCLKKIIPPVALAVIYVIRTGLMNSTYPLANSIMMDCCPPSQRARWKSLESIMVFGWCGSAAIGGHIADKHGYDATFLITAGVQFTSCMMLSVLWPLVPAEKKEDEDEDGKKAAKEMKPMVYEDDDEATEDAPLLSANNSDNVYE